MGYMRLAAGSNMLGIEKEVAWATPGSFTIHNFPCSEDGKNCVLDDGKKAAGAVATQMYEDPSKNIPALEQRLVSLQGNKRLGEKSATVAATRRNIRA